MRVKRMAKLGPKRALSALGALVLAAAVIVGSGANFTGHSANPGNMATSGSFAINNNHEGQALFTPVTNFDPGDLVSGDVTIGNGGTESGNFTVKGVEELGNDMSFADKVSIEVTEYNNPQYTGAAMRPDVGGFMFNGTLKQFLTGTCQSVPQGQPLPPGQTPGPGGFPCTDSPYVNGAYSLNNWDAGQNHYYRFKIRNDAPDGSGNNPAVAAYFNKTVKFAVEWDAVSTA